MLSPDTWRVSLTLVACGALAAASLTGMKLSKTPHPFLAEQTSCSPVGADSKIEPARYPPLGIVMRRLFAHQVTIRELCAELSDICIVLNIIGKAISRPPNNRQISRKNDPLRRHFQGVDIDVVTRPRLPAASHAGARDKVPSTPISPCEHCSGNFCSANPASGFNVEEPIEKSLVLGCRWLQGYGENRITPCSLPFLALEQKKRGDDRNELLDPPCPAASSGHDPSSSGQSLWLRALVPASCAIGFCRSLHRHRLPASPELVLCMFGVLARH